MRKALIIGLGGTGTTICRELAERLRWEYDDLKRIPYVDFFTMDTSKDTVEKSLLDNSSTFYHLTISEQTFTALRDNPKAFDSHNMFSKWYNPEVMDIQNTIEDGTTGIRMLGRMALMLPANWNYIYEAINEKIKALVALTPAEARERFGKKFDGSEPEIAFPNKVYVYVIATACGGTGSGTFMEMGYLLRQLKRQSYPDILTTIGILTLPAASEQDSYRKANAYAVLTELNHFSTDYNEYRDKYPNMPAPITIYNYPYDFPYLTTVDVNRAQQGGLQDFATLNKTIAQYLYSDLFLNVATIRDGRRNDVSRMFISSDRKGLSQRFMTFGVSFIQYPVERIMRGCTYKLLVHAFDRWLGDNAKTIAKDVASVLQMSPDQLYTRLSRTQDGSLDKRFEESIHEIMQPRQYDRVEDLDDLGARLVAAFKKDLTNKPQYDSGADPLSPGLVASTGDQNCAPAIRECLENLRNHIETALFDLNRGPSYCVRFVEQLSAHCTSRQSAKVAVEGAEMRRFYQILKLVAGDFFLKFPLPLARRVQSYYLEQWCHAALEHYHQRLRADMLPIEQQICRTVKEEAILLQQRLKNLDDYLQAGRKHFYALWEDQDRAFNINGILLFSPGSTSDKDDVRKKATITTEYSNLLKTNQRFAQLTPEQAETTALQQVVAKLKPIAIMNDANRNDLFSPEGLSFFDTAGGGTHNKFQKLKEHDESLCVQNAKPFFLDIRRRNVIEAFHITFGADEREAQLRRASDLADWFLPLNINASEFENLPRKRNRWVFFPNKDADPDVDEFRTTVAHVSPPGTHLMPLTDSHTALFLSEYGAFPLRIISGVEDWRQYYQAAMGKLDEEHAQVALKTPSGKDVPTLFNREDIVWIGFNDTDRDLLFVAEEYILVGLALGEIESLQNRDGFIFHAPQLRGREPLTLDADLRKSARKLASDPTYTRILGETLFRRREGGEKDSEIIEMLYTDFPGGRLQSIGLTGLPGKDDQEHVEYVKAVFNRYITRKNNDGLPKAYNGYFQPKRAFQHLFHRLDTPIDSYDPTKTYPEDGYYCENCHQFFGPNESDVPAQCWKQTCRHIYYYMS